MIVIVGKIGRNLKAGFVQLKKKSYVVSFYKFCNTSPRPALNSYNKKLPVFVPYKSCGIVRDTIHVSK